MDNPAHLLVVAAALTDAAGRVLVQRRPAGKQHGGLWEFPGGKVDPGETPVAALVRELAEELGIAVEPAQLEPVAFAGGERIVLLLYRATSWVGEPVALAADELRWVAVAELGTLAMPPADVALVAAIARAAKGSGIPGALL